MTTITNGTRDTTTIIWHKGEKPKGSTQDVEAQGLTGADATRRQRCRIVFGRFRHLDLELEQRRDHPNAKRPRGLNSGL